ncbi:glycosyl hydrolase [Bacteroidia bacterium]|nr:glycosyl hydrolase [Bacteroidia bacterium]
MVEWISTTEAETWKAHQDLFVTDKSDSLYDVEICPEQSLQEIDGFGACFNELGWKALSLLSKKDRNTILAELFQPGKGLNFNIARMPVGANDFSLNWYSYDETKGDFALKDFNIDNDEKTLIPFIQGAKQLNPNLKIWASPWSPPTWMKYNKHYACRPDPKVNDLKGNPNTDLEGTNMFVQEDKYMEAYARYFGKFIDAYADRGIRIYCVAPQNEFNSCQNFPSCTWTIAGLTRFVGRFLGPEMARRNVSIMLGTVERPDARALEAMLNDSLAKKYITNAGFQWAGKGALPKIYTGYPYLRLYQTEQECGDGRNDWKGAVHSWELMLHYLSNGCNVYDYWNIALEKGGISRWGWAQNSLVVVNPQTKTYEYTFEFYLMKHFSHYVLPGAVRLQTFGYDNLLAFKNTNGSVIVVVSNLTGSDKPLKIKIGSKIIQANLKANSFNTIRI